MLLKFLGSVAHVIKKRRVGGGAAFLRLFHLRSRASIAMEKEYVGREQQYIYITLTPPTLTMVHLMVHVTCYHGLLAMMRYATRTVSIVLAAVAVCQADDAAPTAAECITFFTTAQVQDCDAIATFAQCLASTTVDNEFKVRGERVLAKAQEDKPHCTLAVMPKFKVVDREVRAVDMDNDIKQTTLYVVTG